ncbi:MAG TPA: hypothetical protein VMV32_05785 [Ignavibacteriaceae bacterium]|nr:hypothetical protein [Ignavibacteriaceae bacterium]
MKTKYVFLSMIMIIAFTLSVYGQSKYKEKSKSVVKKNDISSAMGKPVFELTVDSLNTKVWILTQWKYQQMMKTSMGKTMDKMKTDNKTMNKKTKNAAMSGTNYFIFDVTNIRNGKEFADTSAKVEIVSPSKKISSVILQPMMNHFGSGVSLKEKGVYLFTINLNIGSGYKTTQFKYRVR